MHAGSFESAGSPRKRTLSRGASEDESLRNIIKETESSARRLIRGDSRGGIFKWGSASQQSNEDQELMMEHPEMFDLQASHDEVLQELRGLELQQETLLFQVDVLQDALEGAEEMLAEAQREARYATLELERERESRRKLEDTVSGLLQAVERLEEERKTKPAVGTLPKEQEREMAGQQAQEVDLKKDGQDQTRNATSDEGSESPIPNNRSLQKGPPLERALLGSSVDSEDVGKMADDSFQLNNMTNKFTGPLVLESQAENGRDPSPDRNNDTDSVSAYEDACADTPELDERDGPRLPDDKGSSVDDVVGGRVLNGSEPKNPNDSCSLS